MSGKINKNILNKEISNLKKKAIEKEAYEVASKILEEKKQEYLNSIADHPVSQELSAGSDGPNVSRTLNGDGNLYSFIGFENGTKPIEDLLYLIERNTRIKQIESKEDIFKFQVYTPSLDELRSQTPMPFENGNSWLKGIEKGISGFSNYLYGLLFENSRSGGGIQSKNKIRRTTYKPVKYFTDLYNKFLKSFK